MNGSSILRITLPAFALLIATQSQAYAYLDPGTGSLLIQGLIAGALAFWFAGKLYISKGIGRVKSLFSKSKGEVAEQEAQSPSAAQSHARNKGQG